MPATKDRVEISIQKILLATDFSSVSRTATTYAHAIAHRFSSHVQLTNVVAQGAPAPATDAHHADLTGSNQARLEKILKEFEGLKAEVREIETNAAPAAALIEESRRFGADLIVMGTSSRHGVEKILVGSTAESVIRSSHCPVLTIGPKVAPPAEDPFIFRNILFATDFSAQASKAAIYALSFAEDSNAHLYLCHVSKVGQASGEAQPSEQEIEASLRRLVPPEAYECCTPVPVVEHGHTPSALLALADKIKADLIVLGSRKSSFWLQYIDTGLTPALLAGAHCPVLTVC
jgi:nucleotide-binding universal stress UspA family protein